MLNELFGIQNRYTSTISLEFKRYLHHDINWNNRLIIITGARGTGKTTLVLQHFLETYNDLKKCLYFSADNPLVLKKGIYRTGSDYFKLHGDCIIIDEVHKQKDWSTEVKGLYDAFPDKKIIILGSSTLNILAEKGDLSRRAIIYSLQPLSFREFLEIRHKTTLPTFTFEHILHQHTEAATRLTGQFKTILGDFNDFLTFGSFPFFLEYSTGDYLNALANVIDKMIYEDITTIKTLKSFSSLKLKKLLGFLASSSVPTFNLETLKNEIEVSRDTLYEYFDLLGRAEIINIVGTKSTKTKAFKNSKILFKSPNLYYTIAYELWHKDILKGNLRESFFASQVGKDHKVYTSRHTDFLVLDGTRGVNIEVGGKNKGKKQIKDLDDAFVFKDGMEIGITGSIPLYLAGFLY